MDSQKVLEVIARYRACFQEWGVEAIEYPHDNLLGNPPDGLAHCHGMLDKMEEFVRDGRMEKVFRWLGFIQGCLWMSGRFSLTDLKNHSRPDDSKPQEEMDNGFGSRGRQ